MNIHSQEPLTPWCTVGGPQTLPANTTTCDNDHRSQHPLFPGIRGPENVTPTTAAIAIHFLWTAVLPAI
ncbi:hypothetical protein JTE90_001083 [Oedothorax gibbosus]|uniref:Uncharacterized protein n=1 Tax=Oedothorax gibbosus TaxID=931172 RepID=A0AAV6UJ34_9ARAC|nr:hypothetical protein JTE90_001083 [Oedothorax gibbosus]